MFTITDSKGFHIEFENGLSVSVQFGRGNYCDNRTAEPDELKGDIKSETAEIAVFNANGNWMTKQFLPKNNGDVMGYLSADNVADLIIAVKNYKS